MLFRRSRPFARPASVRLLIAAAFATLASFASIATFASTAAHAESRTLDGAIYRVPDGWRVEEAPRSVTRHSELDRANGRYCAPAARNVPPLPGWQGRGAGTKFVDANGLESWILVHTYSSGNRRVSFTALTNQPGHYGPAIDAFFASASARDAEGRPVYVALFRSGNNRRWVEVVTPDRAAFEKHLTVVHDGEETDFEPLNRLANLNRFAVAPADLVGEWASSGGAGVEYVNLYTGQSAGLHFASNTERFTFQKDGTYAGEWVGVQNAGGGNSCAGANTRGAYRAAGCST